MTETEAKVWLGLMGITVTAALVAMIVSNNRTVYYDDTSYDYDYEHIVQLGPSNSLWNARRIFSILKAKDDKYEVPELFIKTTNEVSFMGDTCRRVMKYQKSKTIDYYKFCCGNDTKALFYISSRNLNSFLDFLKE
jgi:hypothetical protein